MWEKLLLAKMYLFLRVHKNSVVAGAPSQLEMLKTSIPMWRRLVAIGADRYVLLKSSHLINFKSKSLWNRSRIATESFINGNWLFYIRHFAADSLLNDYVIDFNVTFFVAYKNWYFKFNSLSSCVVSKLVQERYVVSYVSSKVTLFPFGRSKFTTLMRLLWVKWVGLCLNNCQVFSAAYSWFYTIIYKHYVNVLLYFWRWRFWRLPEKQSSLLEDNATLRRVLVNTCYN